MLKNCDQNATPVRINFSGIKSHGTPFGGFITILGSVIILNAFYN